MINGGQILSCRETRHVTFIISLFFSQGHAGANLLRATHVNMNWSIYMLGRTDGDGTGARRGKTGQDGTDGTGRDSMDGTDGTDCQYSSTYNIWHSIFVITLKFSKISGKCISFYKNP